MPHPIWIGVVLAIGIPLGFASIPKSILQVLGTATAGLIFVALGATLSWVFYYIPIKAMLLVEGFEQGNAAIALGYGLLLGTQIHAVRLFLRRYLNSSQ